MKIFIAQQNYHIGNISSNLNKIIANIRQAKLKGGDLIIFSELALCGYSPHDLLEFEDFIEACEVGITAICQEADDIAVIVGAPSKNKNLDGKDLYNSAYFIADKKVQKIINKTLLPNYDVFDEYRYFESAQEWACIEHQGVKIALTICEDIWDLTQNPLYTKRPMDILIKENPDFIINISASPFDYTHADDRYAIAKRNTLRYNLPLIYCTTVGAQTELVFDGGSFVCDAKGNLQKQLAFFEESMESIVWSASKGFEAPIIRPAIEMPDEEIDFDFFNYNHNIHLIYQALILGIRQYFEKMNFKQAIVASSGGIDSAVTLALACDALGAANVFALMMPSQFSTGHSVDDAVQLSQNLNNPYEIVAIKEIFENITAKLEPIFKQMPFNVAEENIQSRIRGVLAMAVSNKHNYILLNTSNKSELATGYGTLYGDMAGGISVLGDLYKTQVYALARYINRDKEIIPENIIKKAPSAELRPDQKDSDSLPEYEILDAILYQFIEHRKSSKQIIAMQYDATIVKKVVGMVNKNEYKRHQFCPIIRVSSKAFGPGRIIPIVAKYMD